MSVLRVPRIPARRILLPGLAASLLLQLPLTGRAWAATQRTTTFSNSSTEQVNTTTAATVRQDTFQTRLTGRVGPDGPVIYDETFALPFTDAQVQAAVTQARALLADAAAPQPVTVGAPALLSSSVSLLGTSTVTTETGRTAYEKFTLTETIGPGSILIGDLNPCTGYAGNPTDGFVGVGCSGGTPFEVQVGTVNVDQLLHTHVVIDQLATTTETYRTAEVYELIATPVPEPTALALAAAAGFGLLARRPRRPA